MLKKQKTRNYTAAWLLENQPDWFLKKRVVAPKKGGGRKKRPRKSNRTNKEKG